MRLLVLNALLALACLVTVYAQDDVAANSVNLPPSDPASLACSTIKLSLGLSIVESSGPEYNATVQGPWSLFNSVDRPTCIVYPRAASHVQLAMARIFEFNSRYAVQAGAHSAMVGYNTVTDGVLISFAHMNSTTYNPVTDTITVQPGVHWGDAMNAVESFGVSVIAGRASDIGTGLLLGGGISLVSPMFGWSADSVKEMDVVLGAQSLVSSALLLNWRQVTGQLVTASATNQHADLFRALKGGANRFGIVTRYELYAAHTGTKEQKNWYGGMIVYPGSSSVALSNASARYIRKVTDPRAGLIVLLNTVNLTAPDANVVYLFYNGASLPIGIFGEFLSIPSTSQTLSPLSYYDISFLRPGNGRGNGNQFGATAWIGAEATFLNGYNHLVNFTQTFESKLLMSTLSISPIPRSQWTATRSGPNAIGGDPGVNYAAINYHLVYPTGVMTRPADVDAGFRFLLSQTPPSAGLPLYINECDASQNIYRTYAEFETLKSTYSKYDPLRFNVRHTVGPIGL